VTSGSNLISRQNSEPFLFEVPQNSTEPLTIHLEFFGHYNEVPFEFRYTDVKSIPGEEHFYLFYNPMIGKWRQTAKEDDFPL
jgi:hypothetical protein